MSDFVLFLDIDGVINTTRVCVSMHNGITAGPFGWIDPIAVNYINRWGELVSGYGGFMRIVVSSTWRTSLSSPNIMLGVMGIHAPAHVHFKTRDTKAMCGSSDSRGDQIDDWLSEHPTSKWMIVDDDSDFSDHHNSRLIKTSTHDGILFNHHLQAESVLAGMYNA